MFKDLRSGLERRAGHVVFGSRKWLERELRGLAGTLHGARILEIGSGRQDLGHDAYSFKHLFADDNEFVESDINPDFGHRVVDVTNMGFVDEWDVILCVSVLEHLPEHGPAVQQLYQALKPGGRAVVVAPMCFPYHDEPHDYWRFTVHGVRAMLSQFDPVEIKCRGPRRLPFTTLAIARKPVSTNGPAGGAEGATAQAPVSVAGPAPSAAPD